MTSPALRRPLSARAHGALATALAGAAVLGASAGAQPRGSAAPPRSTLAVFTVTAGDDLDDGSCSPHPGHCSLREAIQAANAAAGPDTITFHPAVGGGIGLSGPLPHLADAVTVAGPGATTLTVDANGHGSVLWLDPGIVATVSGLGLTGGIGAGAGGTAGGGIVNRGNLTLVDVLIFANSAQFGGAIFNDTGADLVLTASTLRGNSAANFGGAIYNVGSGNVVAVDRSTLQGNSSGTGAVNAPVGSSLSILNSTLTGNTATQPGGVAGVLGGTNVNIRSSTIVGNAGIGVFGSYLRNTIVDSCGSGGGAVSSLGHNLAPSSACFAAAGPGDVFQPSFLLGPPQNNGGPTDTLALLPGSPAIDAGDNANCPATDQRGHARPAGPACDIGAYEALAPAPATGTPTPGPTATASPSPPPTPGCVAPPAGMVAWYPLNETPGAGTVTDLWGGHHGSPQPGPIGGSFGPNVGPVWGPAAAGLVPPFRVAGSLYFWDPARMVVVPPHPALEIGTGAFSLDAWVYSASHVGGGSNDFVSPIVDTFDPASGLGYGLYLRHPVAGPDTLSFVYGDGATVVTASTGAPGLPQGAWVHVAATLARLVTGQLDIRLYVNGLQQGALLAPPPAGPIAGGQSLHIGGMRLVPSVIGAAGYTELAIDELELFNRALGAAEVQAIVAAGGFGKCPPATDRCDLVVRKAAQPLPLPSGQPATFTITVSNQGGAACAGPITLVDALPPSVTVSSVAQGGSPWNCGVSGANPPATVTCTWPAPVPPGTLPVITVTGSVAGAVGSVVRNCAAASNAGDADPANNQACVDLPVVPASGSPGPSRTPAWPWSTYLPWLYVAFRPTATPTFTAPPPSPSSTPTRSATPSRTATGTATPSWTVPPTLTPSYTPPRSPSPTPAPPTATPTVPRATPTPTPPATATASRTATAGPPSLTPGPTPGCAPRPAGMAAWWALDEVGGPLAWDGVGGHDGLVQGAATVVDPAKVAAGRLFDGATGLVAVADAPGLDAGEGDLSLDAWIRPAALDGLRPIVTKQYAPADAPLGYALYLDEGRPAFAMSGPGGSLLGVAPVTVPADGAWHLVAVTVRRGAPGGGQLYLDGEPVLGFDTTPLQGAVDTPAELHLAERPALGRGSPARFFAGALDEVELFHRALGGAEIRSLYTAGTAGKCERPMRPTATRVPWRSRTTAARLGGPAPRSAPDPRP